MGALKLFSGGSAGLAAVDDLRQANGRDLNLVVGQKFNATIGGDLQEQIKSVTGISQRLQAPKTWLGSESVNALQVLCNLLDLVQKMNTQLIHTHLPGATLSPAVFTAKAAQPLELGKKLSDITF